MVTKTRQKRGTTYVLGAENHINSEVGYLGTEKNVMNL